MAILEIFKKSIALQKVLCYNVYRYRISFVRTEEFRMKYENPICEIVVLDNVDVVTVSSELETPVVPVH